MAAPTILSFSPDPELLARREAAFRSNGFTVVSVSTEAEARFEIEMGRCGILLLCSRTMPRIVEELAHVFRQYCQGYVILVASSSAQAQAEADFVVPESQDPEGILQFLSSNLDLPASKAS